MKETVAYSTNYELSPEEVDAIMYIICTDAVPNVVVGVKREKCHAGCGRLIMYRAIAPAKPPKVCTVCAIWLGDCQGEA